MIERKEELLREEIQIVQRRLDDYTAYKALAAEADRKALETAALIRSSGEPKSPSWGKVPVQNHTDLSSILNDLISDQKEYEADASKYRYKMFEIEVYIENNYDGEVGEIMRHHYLEGLIYEDIEEMMGYSSSALKMKVYRAIEASDFSGASAIM